MAVRVSERSPHVQEPDTVRGSAFLPIPPMTPTPFSRLGQPQRGLWLWMGLWIGLGTLLRFWGLASKPLWTDEFATIVFSLGHSFRTIPLDQGISSQQLLAPALEAIASPQEVLTHLLSESNHPPLYFLLTHVWLWGWQQIAPLDETTLVWAVRSLPVLIGVLLIPAMYLVGQLLLRSPLAAQLSAALMALSPFAVYLSQEARHYTLPMLWIILSMGCWGRVVRSLQEKQQIPWGIIFVWIGVNGLGIATHYFFAFTLIGEAIALLLIFACLGRWGPTPSYALLSRLGVAVLGTVASSAVWWRFLVASQDSELTRWIYRGDRTGWAWLDPLGQAIAGWITMLYLLPIQAASDPVVLVSGLLLVGMTVATLIYLSPRLWQQWQTANLVIRGLMLMAIALPLLFLGITYGLGMDLTSAFRYNFVYFPVVLWVVSLALGSRPSRRVTAWILIATCLGSITVVTNLGYQKTHRPDRVATAILSQSPPDVPILIAIPHRTHGQTGRLMAIAWALQPRLSHEQDVTYLLAHDDPDRPNSALTRLDQTLRDRPTPLALWLVNGQSLPSNSLSDRLAAHQCQSIDKARSVDGYRYQPFLCHAAASGT